MEMPLLCRARGLWGGPEPEEIRALSYVERKALQLARTYACIKHVRQSQLKWTKDRPDTAPQYTTRNVTAYPQDPDKILRSVCMMPEEICSHMAVHFFGNDVSVLPREPALQLNVVRLRSAMWWLATNCWQWMLATKAYGIMFENNLGKTLEDLLAIYRSSLGNVDEGSAG